MAKYTHEENEARAAELAATRARLGWSQQDVAEVLQVNPKSVKRWEQAKPGYNVPDDALAVVRSAKYAAVGKARQAVANAMATGEPVVCTVKRADGVNGKPSGEVIWHNAEQRMIADWAEAAGLAVEWRFV